MTRHRYDFTPDYIILFDFLNECLFSVGIFFRSENDLGKFSNYINQIIIMEITSVRGINLSSSSY